MTFRIWPWTKLHNLNNQLLSERQRRRNLSTMLSVLDTKFRTLSKNLEEITDARSHLIRIAKGRKAVLRELGQDVAKIDLASLGDVDKGEVSKNRGGVASPVLGLMKEDEDDEDEE